jgi:hypothetical protein
MAPLAAFGAVFGLVFLVLFITEKVNRNAERDENAKKLKDARDELAKSKSNHAITQGALATAAVHLEEMEEHEATYQEVVLELANTRQELGALKEEHAAALVELEGVRESKKQADGDRDKIVIGFNRKLDALRTELEAPIDFGQ